jgi:hypothetical protein
MGRQSSRERQLWTEFVRAAEEHVSEKKAKRSRVKNEPQPTPAKLEAALDDLVKATDKERAP